MRPIPNEVVALTSAWGDARYHPACVPEGVDHELYQLYAGDSAEGFTYLCKGCGKRIKGMKASEFW